MLNVWRTRWWCRWMRETVREKDFYKLEYESIEWRFANRGASHLIEKILKPSNGLDFLKIAFFLGWERIFTAPLDDRLLLLQILSFDWHQITKKREGKEMSVLDAWQFLSMMIKMRKGGIMINYHRLRRYFFLSQILLFLYAKQLHNRLLPWK